MERRLFTLIPMDEILKGYVRDEYSGAELNFRYRPIGGVETADVTEKMKKQAPEVMVNTMQELIIDRVVDWDVKDPKGDPLPITKENINRLRIPLGKMMFEDIMNSVAWV